MNGKKHFVASVIIFIITMFIQRDIIEYAKAFTLIFWGYFPDIDNLKSVKYHRNWFTHSIILPGSLCLFFYYDPFFWIMMMIQAAHLIMDMKFKKVGGSYCIVKPSGDRMNYERSTAWLGVNGIPFLIIAIYAMFILF